MTALNDDVAFLTRRLDAVTRAVDQIARHLVDLHYCGWERPTGDQAHVQETRTDHTPQAGDPRARHLWSRISLQVGQVEDVLVGLHRQMAGYFYSGSTNPEPSRGSRISRQEHDQLLANQRTRRANGEYTPTPLVDQPQHPGAQR